MRALLDAGASPTLADRKGLCAGDLATWSALWLPAAMAPLQNAAAQLQQAGATHARRTQELLSRAAAARERGRFLSDQVQRSRASVHAITAAREHTRQRTAAAQSEELRVKEELRVEAPEIARLQRELLTLRGNRDGVQLDVDRIRAGTAATLRERERKLELYEEAQRWRLRAAAERSAVHCEVVALACRFSTSEALQAQALRALLTMCRKPGACKRLEHWGEVPHICIVGLIAMVAADAVRSS